MEDEQRGIRLGFNEPQGGQIGSKLTEPSLGCLLEPVQGLVQATDHARLSRVGEARGLAAEDCLRESIVEEDIFHVEMLNGPVTLTVVASTVRTVAGFTTEQKVSS
jgi:hypothetical protein